MGRLINISTEKDYSTFGEPPAETHFEKYLDAKFDGLGDKLDACLAAIDQKFNRIETDVKEISTDVREIKSNIKGISPYFIGATLVVIAILIGLLFYTTIVYNDISMLNQYFKTIFGRR